MSDFSDDEQQITGDDSNEDSEEVIRADIIILSAILNSRYAQKSENSHRRARANNKNLRRILNHLCSLLTIGTFKYPRAENVNSVTGRLEDGFLRSFACAVNQGQDHGMSRVATNPVCVKEIPMKVSKGFEEKFESL